MNKSELRKIFLEKRRMLSPDVVAERSQKIASLFFKHFQLDLVHSIHVYMPIAKNNEPDTTLIIQKLFDDFPHIKVVVSISELSTNKMTHFEVNKSTRWTINKWGIPEPVDGIKFDPKQLDLVLVPLIVADRTGNRIGYGKGYFDRFLAEDCRKEVITIGLSLSPLIDEVAYFDIFDKKLRYCINQYQLIEF
jgi:5-formyltetrahydrofolate cyclo-ligase